MAIRDLLWACPICGRESALEQARKGERCQQCGTHFSRDGRALITARQPGHPPVTRSPAEWLERLPDLRIEERIAQAAAQGEVIRTESAILRTEIDSQPVYFRGTYLNRIERLGPPRAGELRLEAERLAFLPAEVPEDDPTAAVIWEFDAITAVQPSSSTLQLKALGGPLASLRVPGGSIRLWEEFICAALRCHYRKKGRGEIVEFQPRITTRSAP
jgi:hypothetical protein